MDKNRLLEMADNPELIPGIYNYCDRWCERCDFTSRCLQFQMEQEEEDLASTSSTTEELNAEFWEKVTNAFSMAIELIKDIAEREGIDLDHDDTEEEMAERRKNHEKACSHPCSQAALAYSDMVDAWFESTKESWEEKDAELLPEAQPSLPHMNPVREAYDMRDAAEVIRWYQYFIYPKVARALEGKLQGVSRTQEGMPRDSDGSAKVAMIAIDHSIGAWGKLHREFPDKKDETLRILVHLERLRRSMEGVFPNARAFIRPGFDE